MDVFFVILWIVSIVLCGVVASKKGRFVFGWVLLGFLLSFIALIIVLVISDLSDGVVQAKKAGRIQCPSCKEFIRPGASICPMCRTELTPWPPLGN